MSEKTNNKCCCCCKKDESSVDFLVRISLETIIKVIITVTISIKLAVAEIDRFRCEYIDFSPCTSQAAQPPKPHQPYPPERPKDCWDTCDSDKLSDEECEHC